mgnify:CR=1 FL=1
MKFELNIKLFLVLLFLTVVSTMFYTTAVNAAEAETTITRNNDECTGNGGTITLPGTTDCEFEPDEMKIRFYRLDMCTEAPGAPTTTTEVDRSNCFTFFKNDAGSLVKIQKDVGTPIGNPVDYKMIPLGAYSHGLVTMDAVFKYKDSWTLTGNMTDFDSNESTTCVTKSSSLGDVFGMDNRINSHAKANYSCEDGATAEYTSYQVSTLTTDGSGNCFTAINFTGTDSIITVYGVNSMMLRIAGSGSDDKIDSGDAGCVVGNGNTYDKMLGIMPITLNITPETTGLQIRYNIQRALVMDMGSTSNRPDKLDAGFFDFTIEAQ